MQFKTVIISDLHLGSHKAQADRLLAFLKTVKCDTLILNGDIIDMWSLSREWYFPQVHLQVVQSIIRLSKHTNVILLPGNHDPITKYVHDVRIGNIKIVDEHVHFIKDKKFLIQHGDAFDVITRYSPLIAKLGDHAYEFALWVNIHFNNLRFLLGMKYWSLSKFLKNSVKSVVKFIFAFEHAAIDSVRQLGYNGGIILGHIHCLALYKKDGIIYSNSGDWVETCSWIAETDDGRLQTWEWNDGDPKMIAELIV